MKNSCTSRCFIHDLIWLNLLNTLHDSDLCNWIVKNFFFCYKTIQYLPGTIRVYPWRKKHAKLCQFGYIPKRPHFMKKEFDGETLWQMFKCKWTWQILKLCWKIMKSCSFKRYIINYFFCAGFLCIANRKLLTKPPTYHYSEYALKIIYFYFTPK